MENGRIKAWLPAIRGGSGAEIYTRRLADALQRHGIAAHVTWFSGYDELVPVRLLHAQPPPGTDIVLANSWHGYAFKRVGLPLIVTVHHAIFEPDLDAYKGFPQRFYHRHLAAPREARSLRAADAVIAVSAYVAGRLRERHGIEGIEVIHNWVDAGKYCPAEPVQKDPRRPFHLLFVGKPTRLKGADLLGPVMRKLGLGFELQVTASAGSCRGLDFPPNAYPAGWLPEHELIRAYQQCDALLCLSRSEGFGYAALEAMACGKPVIAANLSSLPELIVNGETGLLCESCDVDQLANCCRLLEANTALCHKMGLFAKLRAIEQFSENKAVARYFEIMRGFL